MRIENKLFYCENLLDRPESLNILKTFSITKETGRGLEYYLKNAAVFEETRNLARTYLVRDLKTGELVGYFSLKSGSVATNVQKSLFRIEMDALPAIELSNFAVNDNYKKVHKEYRGLGDIIFSYFILPICRMASTYIGVNTLYIFALPYEPLIKYYESMHFERLPKRLEAFTHHYHKPRYDKGCVFMSRSLDDIAGVIDRG